MLALALVFVVGLASYALRKCIYRLIYPQSEEEDEENKSEQVKYEPDYLSTQLSTLAFTHQVRPRRALS